jgi:hypothetical protein
MIFIIKDLSIIKTVKLFKYASLALSIINQETFLLHFFYLNKTKTSRERVFNKN